MLVLRLRLVWMLRMLRVLRMLRKLLSMRLLMKLVLERRPLLLSCTLVGRKARLMRLLR